MRALHSAWTHLHWLLHQSLPAFKPDYVNLKGNYCLQIPASMCAVLAGTGQHGSGMGSGVGSGTGMGSGMGSGTGQHSSGLGSGHTGTGSGMGTDSSNNSSGGLWCMLFWLMCLDGCLSLLVLPFELLHVAPSTKLQAMTHTAGGGLMSKIPGTQANKEAKAEQGQGTGSGMGSHGHSSTTGSGDLVCHTLNCYMCMYLYCRFPFVQ